MLFTIVSLGVAKNNEFSWPIFIYTFLFCYVFFEFWFYSSHRLIHKRSLAFIHKTHHVSVTTTPLSALNLSLSEKAINDLGMLIIPSLLSHQLPLSFEAIMTYHLYNFYVNVLGHSNLELLPKFFTNSLLGKFFTSSTYHSIHHLKGHCNYGLFTTFFDQLFGTYDPHYPQIINKILNSGPQSRRELVISKKCDPKVA